MRLTTFNKYQIRFGWLRVIARRVRGQVVSPAELESHLTEVSAQQDEWLRDFSPPQGRASDRAVPDLVRMAVDYGVYDRTAHQLAGLGAVLAECDIADENSCPLAWDYPLGVLGLRLVFNINGSLIYLLLKGWRDDAPVKDQIRDILTELAQHDATAASLLRRFGNKDPNYPVATVVWPVLEPLRELGLVNIAPRSDYWRTEVGVRFAERLARHANEDEFLNKGLVDAWVTAHGHTPRPITSDQVQAYLARFPPGLGGVNETTVPEPLLAAWLATEALRDDAALTADFSAVHSCLLGLSQARQVRLMPGTLPSDIDVAWGGPAGPAIVADDADGRVRGVGDDPATPGDDAGGAGGRAQFGATGEGAGGGEGDRDGDGAVGGGSGGEEAGAVDDGAAGGGTGDGGGGTDEGGGGGTGDGGGADDGAGGGGGGAAGGVATPPHVVEWCDYVHRLLLAPLTPVQGGPRVWIWYLSQLVGSETLPDFVLDNKRKDSAFASDPDAAPPNRPKTKNEDGRIFCVHTGGVGEFHRAYSAQTARFGECEPLLLLTERWADTNIGRARMKAVLTEIDSDTEALRRALGHRVRTWLQSSNPAVSDFLAVARVTRWLVEDALQRDGADEGELFQLLAPKTTAAAESVLQRLEGTAEAVYTLSQTFALVGDVPPDFGDLLAQNFETFTIIEGRLVFEMELSAPSATHALAAAEHERADGVAWIEFFLTQHDPKFQLVPDSELLVEGFVASPVPDQLADVPTELGFVSAPLPPPRREPSILRSLQLLRTSRLETVPAVKLSHLWAAIEHLVSIGDLNKGNDAIRSVSSAASWVFKWAEAAEVQRRTLAGLHAAAFVSGTRLEAIELISRLDGPEAADVYRRVPDAVLQARAALFGAPRRVSGGPKALMRLLRSECENPDTLKRAATLIEARDLATAAALSRFAELAKRKEFSRELRQTRRDIAGTLAWVYDIRNRVVHEGYTGEGEATRFLKSLHLRTRRCVELVVQVVGSDAWDGAPLPVRWATFDEWNAGVHDDSVTNDSWLRRLDRQFGPWNAQP